MKHSQTIGIIFSLAMMAICFLPWVYIPSHQITVTGLEATGTDFGKPGYANMVLGTVMVLLFAIPALWSKRTNVFVAALNLAWSFRNYLLLTTCLMGECPEKRISLYLLLFFSLITQVMVLLPKMELKKSKS